MFPTTHLQTFLLVMSSVVVISGHLVSEKPLQQSVNLLVSVIAWGSVETQFLSRGCPNLASQRHSSDLARMKPGWVLAEPAETIRTSPEFIAGVQD